MSSRFDLDAPPQPPLPEDVNVEPPKTAQQTNKVKLITVPVIGIKFTIMQLVMIAVMFLGLIIYALSKGSPQQTTSSTPKFTSQEPVAEQPVSSSAEEQPFSSISQSTVIKENSPPPISENTLIEKETGEIKESINNLQIYSENNREGIKALDQRLRALEQQFSPQQPHLSAPVSPINSTAPKQTAKKISQSGSKKTNFQGASIASLYPGLAWVNYKGSTWALRQGDRIGNATVKTIDIHKREVITTAGIIR
ncbi:hypothetical protein Xmau_03847 [Xenorhabdus mauleonii]|uniref:TraP protein n=1 Tax=Xenorhabdus mauleonii TaxID=351675 RepID=A0A1I3V7D5_9GAMM|nr:hypothetical protein [Xenorhabdus mauleonii]PHM37629.1 hypothetical protein Xmau_03847 [Xenorhabdus mauleonii]SFJ90256.1 hypothetical protein SAMN05421680_11951 [Xenorhabdus mauleonii]